MFFRPEISLIPTVLALSNFFIANYPHIAWYSFWYLGNPFSYLIGPIAPGLLLILSKVIPWPLYNLYLSLVILSLIIGGLGVYSLTILFSQAENNKLKGLIAGALYILLPLTWLGLYYENGLKQISFAVIPFVLIIYKIILNKTVTQNPNRKKGHIPYFLLLIALITVCMLITVNVLLPLVIGITAVFITQDRFIIKDSLSDKVRLWLWREETAVQALLFFIFSLSLATFWYTPRFWLVLLTNPSFGGLPLWNLIVKLFQYLINLLPLLFAILVVKWKFRSQKLFFGFLFFLSFFFLTIVRFLADPKFIIDWIGFIPELQFGLSIIGGGFAGWLIKNNQISQKAKVKRQNFSPKAKIYLGISVFLLIGVLFFISSAYLAYNLFIYPKSSYQTDIIEILKTHITDKSARLFLSGSDVFWLNSFLSFPQVRGGNDGASIHPFWSHGAFQIREGESGQLTTDWLKILGSSYILVHQENSRDTFHDFQQTEKFTKYQLQAEDSGETLYKIPESSIARIADRSLISLPRPENGADSTVLNKYASTLKSPIGFKFINAETISLNARLSKNEIVNLAISYDPSWKIKTGKGSLISDSLGNIVILPDNPGNQKFTLKYERSWADLLLPLALSILSAITLWKFNFLYPRIRKRLPKIHLGLGAEDEEY